VLLLCVVLRLTVEHRSRRGRTNHNMMMTMKEEGLETGHAAGEEDDTDAAAKKTCGERKNRDDGER
jgi:hypothetical protein